jgi:hypothetical protein
MSELQERGILETMRNLRQAPIDRSRSDKLIERVRISLAPAPESRRRRIAAAAVAIAALFTVVLYLRWPEPRTVETKPSAPVVVIPPSPAEELKQALIRSQAAGPVVHAQLTSVPLDASGAPIRRIQTIGGVRTAAIQSQPTSQTSRGYIPLTWEGVKTIPIPLDWPSYQMMPVTVNTTTKIEKLDDAAGVLYRIATPAPVGDGRPTPPAGAKVWVEHQSGLITRMELPGNSLDQIRQLTLTYESLSPTTAASEASRVIRRMRESSAEAPP